jgi:ubiquitin-protein ligase E3 C
LPGGRDIEVTNANVLTYVHLLAHFKLNLETAAQCRAFLRGFRDLVPVPWIRLFSPRELQRLIGGDSGDRGIDIADLKANMKYAGGYHPSQPVMQWFWAALESFTPKEQALFLKFVTSCSRQPLLGFRHLAPPICVQKVPAGAGGNKLPSSATCMNLLKLPQYEDAQTLRDKLLYAISAEAGFELT